MSSTDTNTTVPVNAALSLSQNWITADIPAAATTSTWNGGLYYYQTIPYYTTNPPRIRLTLSEIERLRVAAKKDKALVAILGKFTDLIDVAVDFK